MADEIRNAYNQLERTARLDAGDPQRPGNPNEPMRAPDQNPNEPIEAPSQNPRDPSRGNPRQPDHDPGPETDPDEDVSGA